MATTEEKLTIIEEQINSLLSLFQPQQPVRFWQGMTRTDVVQLLDKIMVGVNTDGSTKYTDVNKLVNLISAATGSGIEPPPTPNTVLPAPEQANKITVLPSGNYTQPGGGSLTVDPLTLTIGFWDGVIWSKPIEYPVTVDTSVLVEKASVGVANGVVGSDENNKVLFEQMPDISGSNINDNYRWLRGLFVADGNGSGAPEWAYIAQYGSTALPWGLSAPTLEASVFDYSGNSVSFPWVGTGNMSVVVPNAGFINTGNQFKAIIEIKSDLPMTLSIVLRRNASLQTVSNTVTVTLTPNVPQRIDLDAIATDNSTRYIFHISRNSGTGTVNFYVGRVFVGFGGLSIDGENQAALDYLRRKGLSFDLDAKNKILKNISLGSDNDAVPLGEAKRLANMPMPENLLLTNKQETEIWAQNIPEPGDSYTMIWNHINPAITTPLASAQDTLDVTKTVAESQVPVFSYRGNCLVFDLSGVANNNFQSYIQFKLNQLAKSPKTNMVYMKIEIASQNQITIPSLRGYRTSTTVIDTDGSLNNNTVINNVPKVVTISLNTDLITQNPKENEWIGLRLFFGTTQPVSAGQIYIGRIVVSDDPNCDINTPSINSLRLKEGIKIGVWGDSIVRQMRIDPKAIRRLGAYFSTTEIANGRNGHQPTAIGGTRIMPYSDFTPGQSIYERISEASAHYRGDIDVLRGGANDPRAEYISASLWTPSLILGQVTDPAYTGTSYPAQADYLAYWNGIKGGASRDSGNISDFTFASVYKGCLQKLINARPNGKVFSMTVFIPSGGSSYQTNVWNPMWDLVVQISASLGVKCIDARSEAGINLLNADLYYSQVDRVHPNNEAGKMIADTQIRYLGSVERTI